MNLMNLVFIAYVNSLFRHMIYLLHSASRDFGHWKIVFLIYREFSMLESDFWCPSCSYMIFGVSILIISFDFVLTADI